MAYLCWDPYEPRSIPVRKTRNLTLTVDGEDRDATWKEGVGIYVSGHDFGKGDTVGIEGTPYEVVEMRRMVMEGEALTLIIKSRQVDA